MVLQGFSANLTMLDGAKGTGYKPGGDAPGDYGMDGDRAAGTKASGTDTGNFSRDLDDDIPF